MKHLIFGISHDSTGLFFSQETSNEEILKWLKEQDEHYTEYLLQLNEGWSCTFDLDNNLFDVPTIVVNGDEDYKEFLIVEVNPIKINNNQ
jgi:hypothetical protein